MRCVLLGMLLVGVVGGALVLQARDAREVANAQRSASLQALRLADTGHLDEARELLIEAWALDRSQMYLREQLRDVNLALIARDSRKAHVLHGREGPGGVLEPEDLMP